MTRTEAPRTRSRSLLPFLAVCVAGFGCAGEEPSAPRLWREGPALPVPVTNNAVAGIDSADGRTVR